jgi:hypothetical protein
MRQGANRDPGSRAGSGQERPLSDNDRHDTATLRRQDQALGGIWRAEIGSFDMNEFSVVGGARMRGGDLTDCHRDGGGGVSR